MPEQRKIAISILFFIFTSFLSGYGQGNNSWLQRSWNGKAFVLSNGPKENYDLVLTIGKIKGKNFEGNLKTIKPSDTAIQFNTKVEGVIYEKHMLINIGTWKINCGNCKPQSLAFSIENGKFYLKGEAKGCSQECTWITVFSTNLIDFDVKTQDDLFAAAEEIIIEPADTTASLAENTPPPEPEKKKEPEITSRIMIIPAGTVVLTQKDLTANSAKRSINKSPGLTINEAVPEKRIPVIAAGSVVVDEKPSDLNPGIPKGNIDKNAGLKVNDAIPEKRIPLIAAGSVVVDEKSSALSPVTPKGGIDKNAGLKVNDAVPEKRIPLIAAGSVVVDEKSSALSPGTPKGSIDKNAGLKVNDAVPEKRIPVLEAGAIVVSKKKPLNVPGNPKGMNKNPGLKVNDAVPEKRIPVIAAGAVVVDNKQKPLTPGNPSAGINKNTGLKVDETIPDKKIPILPAGAVVTGEKNNAALVPQQNKSSSKNQPSVKIDPDTKVKPPVVKDTASGLPEGYAERKKTVVKTIDVNTDSITLQLYDNGIVDGDIVSVVYNDQVVVDKLSLIARALVIKLPVKKDMVNKLVFHAHNLGEFPPNTAKLEVQYGNKREELTISSDYTISSAIDIIYQQKP